MTLGPQWGTGAYAARPHLEGLEQRGFIVGKPLKRLYDDAGIVLHRGEAHPLGDSDTLQPHWDETPGVVSPSEDLHTTQAFLHQETLSRYQAGDIPKFDPDFEQPTPYMPWVFDTHRGTPWINEGHHRIVAARLKDSNPIKAWRGYLG